MLLKPGKKPGNEVMSTKSDPFFAFDRKRLGLNWFASLPQLESSICTSCIGTTSIVPAGMVMPVSRFRS